MATEKEMKMATAVKISREYFLPWKKEEKWSMRPVMTHSSPPMPESKPSMINMKKNSTDQM